MEEQTYYLGIELGSTRIKSVLIDDQGATVAHGSTEWQNQYEQQNWTYSLNEVWQGIQLSFNHLKQDYEHKMTAPLVKITAIGISAMMHGYLAFSDQEELLVPFRTWRNTTTAQAAKKLTDYFHFNIPQRWSIAHFYQAILNQEPHVAQVNYLTTLAGYVHWQLTGEKVLGIGDASGMFPVDSTTHQYRQDLLAKFEQLPAVEGKVAPLHSVLPKIKLAGEQAGTLTAKGARLLDPTGDLQPGSVFAPPEGDAGTGMVATNSVRVLTGNVSVGTSAFSMIVLPQKLQQVHEDIDIVATPAGDDVAMVHANNCSSDLNIWLNWLQQTLATLGISMNQDEVYQKLFKASEQADPQAGGLYNFGFLSGEPLVKVSHGYPAFLRDDNAQLTPANFIKAHLYGAFAPLKIGMDILARDEHIEPKRLVAQGGLFKTPIVAQQVLADVLGLPISTLATASEGGAWGMAVLARYVLQHEGQDLATFLDQQVFVKTSLTTLTPHVSGQDDADHYLKRYRELLPLEQTL